MGPVTRRAFLQTACATTAGLITEPLLSQIIQVPHPEINRNFYNKRAEQYTRERPIDTHVIHTSEGPDTYEIMNQTEEGLIHKLMQNNKEAKTLAHYLVGRTGTIYEFLDPAYRAHHSGPSRHGHWSLHNGLTDIDHNSIGTEIHAWLEPKNPKNFRPITDAQYASLKILNDWIMYQHRLRTRDVVGHLQVAAWKIGDHFYRGRKGDPNPQFFEWSRLGLPNNYELLDQDAIQGTVRRVDEKIVRTFFPKSKGRELERLVAQRLNSIQRHTTPGLKRSFELYQDQVAKLTPSF
jgi:N-acetyl-anhydromuramyl-L-alanine amidase AmpD